MYWPAWLGTGFVYHGSILSVLAGVSCLFILIRFTASWTAAVVVSYLHPYISVIAYQSDTQILPVFFLLVNLQIRKIVTCSLVPVDTPTTLPAWLTLKRTSPGLPNLRKKILWKSIATSTVSMMRDYTIWRWTHRYKQSCDDPIIHICT